MRARASAAVRRFRRTVGRKTVQIALKTVCAQHKQCSRGRMAVTVWVLPLSGWPQVVFAVKKRSEGVIFVI